MTTETEKRDLARAMTATLSPDGLATIAAAIRSADALTPKPLDPATAAAFAEARWLASLIIDTIGPADYDEIVDDLGL